MEMRCVTFLFALVAHTSLYDGRYIYNVYKSLQPNNYGLVAIDSSIAIGFGGCFPPTSVVITDSGQAKSMSMLRVGDRILSINQDGHLEFSDVIAFLDIQQENVAKYYTLITQSGHSITLTGKHLIHTTELGNYTPNMATRNVFHSSQLTNFKFVEEVIVGQYIFVVRNITASSRENMHWLTIPNSVKNCHSTLTRDIELSYENMTFTNLIPDKVVSIKFHSIRGAYAPLTLHGTIIVDNIAASCYAFIKNEQLAHLVFTPLRRYYVITKFISDSLIKFFDYSDWTNRLSCFYETKRNETVQQQQFGIHWYARILYTIAVNIVGIKIDILV